MNCVEINLKEILVDPGDKKTWEHDMAVIPELENIKRWIKEIKMIRFGRPLDEDYV